MTTHEQRLRHAAMRRRRDEERLAASRVFEQDAITAAHIEGGMSVRAIAALSGLTYGRIGQIVKAAKAR